MSTQFTCQNPTSYFGLNATNPGQNWFRNRDPTSTDWRNYTIGDRWTNRQTGNMFVLYATPKTDPINHNAKWVKIGSWTDQNVQFLTGDDAVPIIATNNNINIVGDSAQGVSTSNSAPSTMKVTVADATVTTKGVSKYDTDFFSVAAGDVTLKGPFTSTGGVVTYDGTGISTSTATIDSLGNFINYPTQTMFYASSIQQASVTGDGTSYDVHFATTTKNVGGGYNGLTTFRAPVNGNYLLTATVALSSLDAGHVNMDMFIGGQPVFTVNPFQAGAATGLLRVNASTITYMAANATATVGVVVSGGTKTVWIDTGSYFQGILLC